MPTALRTYWSDNRGDNFATATVQGEQDAQAAGYALVREEALVFTEAEQQPGMVPLRLFWDPTREDNFTTATAQGVQDAQAAGYQEVRVEGYAAPNPAGERVVRGQAERDFGGGKHGTANAVLDGAGRLTATVATWTNSPFQGFTMGVKVLLLDANRGVIAETTGGPGPYGVNGRLVPGGPSERIDVFTQDFGPAQAANAATLAIFLFWAPRWRLLEIVNQVVVVAVAVGEWVAQFCQQYPDACQWVQQTLSELAEDDS